MTLGYGGYGGWNAPRLSWGTSVIQPSAYDESLTLYEQLAYLRWYLENALERVEQFGVDLERLNAILKDLEETYTRAQLDVLLAGKAALVHTHAGTDITSLIPPDKLGAGVPGDGKYLSGTGTWEPLPPSLALDTLTEQVDLYELACDLSPRYTTMEFVRLGSVLFQVELSDGQSNGAVYSWVKDPADDYFKMSQCSVGYGTQAGSFVSIQDANHSGTWANIAGQNRYTTTVGAGFTLTIPKGNTDLSLRILCNDSGGLWNVTVDGNSVSPVSCWSALAAPNVEEKVVKIASGLDRSVPHTVVATFAGSDPAHPVATPRGWVRKDDAKGTLVGEILGAAPVTPVLASVSNKEFAFMTTVNGTTSYIPEHNSTPTTYAKTPMKILIDGAPINFGAMLNGDRVTIKNSIDIVQDMTARVAGVDVLELRTSHTVTMRDGVHFAGRWRAIASATISGYPLMLPSADATTGEFVTSLGNSQTTRSDESTVAFTEDADRAYGGAVISGANKNVIGAATMRNPRVTMRRNADHKLPENERMFVWHRGAPSAPKMYWSAMNNWPIDAGDSYAWTFDLIVAQVPDIYEIVKPDNA